MKKIKNSQSGSAHVIVVAVLVVALISTLGWIFWQNFLQKKTTDSVASTSSSTKTSDNVKVASSDVMVFPKWDVELNVGTDEIYAKEVEFIQDGSKYYYYDIVANDGVLANCYPEMEKPYSVGRFAQYAADSKEEAFGWNDGSKTWREVAAGNDKAVLVGDYVYVFNTPQQGCGDFTTSEGKATNAKQESLTKKVTDAIKMMKASS